MSEDIFEEPIVTDEEPIELPVDNSEEPSVKEPPTDGEVIDSPIEPNPEPIPEPDPVIGVDDSPAHPEPDPNPEPEFITQVFYEEVYTIPEDCVEVAPPPFYKPRWDGEQWVEEGERPADPPHVPTPEEKIAAQEEEITMLEMALVDTFEQSLELQTQNELAMVEMYELMFG